MQLKTVEECFQYMQSGDVRVVFESIVSHNRFTYWIKENRTGKAFQVYLIARTGGAMGYLGAVVNGEFQRGEHSRVSVNAPAYKAFVWVWQQLCAYRMPPQTIIETVGQYQSVDSGDGKVDNSVHSLRSGRLL